MSRHGVPDNFTQIRMRIALSGATTTFPPRMIRIARIPSGPNPRRRAANLSFGSDAEFSNALASGDCPHHEKWFLTFDDRVGQGSVWRFVRNVFATGEEAHQR